jgi:glycosyltransferase involved in cell wall biosynthesis
MPSLSIVIPVYFNEGSLPELETALNQLEKDLAEEEVETELIFVNDGSRDRSLDLLRQMQLRRPKTVLLNHLSNQGSMSAIQTGLRRVTGDCFTYLAADLQDPPEFIVEMVREWRQGERFVVRTRSSRQDPPLTRFFAWLNYRLVRLLIMPTYPETGFDMAVMDKLFLPHLLRCGHNKNLAMFAWSLGIPAKTLTSERRQRKHGKSMWTFRKKLNYFIDSSVGFSVKPMRLATGIGFVIASGCFLYAGVVVLGKLLGLIDVPGFAALAALMGFLNGCAFIFLGLLGEYVWRIYREMDRHAEAVVEEIKPAMPLPVRTSPTSTSSPASPTDSNSSQARA